MSDQEYLESLLRWHRARCRLWGLRLIGIGLLVVAAGGTGMVIHFLQGG